MTSPVPSQVSFCFVCPRVMCWAGGHTVLMGDAAGSTSSSASTSKRDTNFTENKGGEGCLSFSHILPYLCSVISTQFVFLSG